MAAGQMTSPMRHIRRLALQNAGGVGDAQLLGAFLTQKDEAAFEALVRRHGPMVLGVCRRVLRDAHDAQDAFQATFLVLVRKAAAIAKRELLGNWLYGVAFRAALKMKHAKATRHRKERQVDQMSRNQSPSPEISEELLSWLDHELNQLPEKYRVAIVFCDLESMTRDQAARKLGWPIGTLNWRLAKARSLVAKGLKRRGLAISCAALAALCQKTAAAAVPPALTSATVKLGTLMAAGTAVKLGMITAQVASLTEGVVKAMFLSKLKTALALVVVIGTLGVGAGRVSYSVLAAEKGTAVVDGPNAKKSAAATDPVIKPAAADGEEVTRFGNIYVIGKTLNFDEDNNTVVVNGPGRVNMMIGVNFKGEKLSEPRVVTIHWNKEMSFDGKHADFRGGVRATQDGASLKCKDLLVTLDRTMSLKEGRKQKVEAKIVKMTCDQQISIEHDKKDPTGKRVESDRLTASKLIVSVDAARRVQVDWLSAIDSVANDERVVTARGPGHVEFFGKFSNAADAMRLSMRLSLLTDAEVKALRDKQKTTLTRVAYEDHMYIHSMDRYRGFTFDGNVEFLQIPTDDPNAPMPPGHKAKDGISIKSDFLYIVSRVADIRVIPSLSARGNVSIRFPEFSGTADSVTYDGEDELVLTGKRGHLATLILKRPGAVEPQEIRGDKILYNRRTGVISIDRGNLKEPETDGAAQKPPNDPTRKAEDKPANLYEVARENDGAKAPMPNRLDELFQVWDRARKTTRSLVIEFDHETVDRLFKSREKAKMTVRLIQTADGKVFARHVVQDKTDGQDEGLLSGGKLYLLSPVSKTAIRLNTEDDGVAVYLEKWFNPLFVLLDRKRAEQCKRLAVESDKFYTYVHVRPKEGQDSGQFGAGRVAVLNEATVTIPKGMPKQLWYSDSTHEHCIGIRSWRVNEAAAPDLKEFQRPEQRPGWQVVQWRNSGKGFSLFGGWFEPVTD